MVTIAVSVSGYVSQFVDQIEGLGNIRGTGATKPETVQRLLAAVLAPGRSTFPIITPGEFAGLAPTPAGLVWDRVSDGWVIANRVEFYKGKYAYFSEGSHAQHVVPHLDICEGDVQLAYDYVTAWCSIEAFRERERRAAR